MTINWTSSFQHKLLQWYESQQRILPWRGYDDPYAIWVSEIMLQQTRVEAVLPYFERFMETFPRVEDLAAAEQEEVLKRWEGLGYYSRARNLHQAAQMVVEEYAGQVPATHAEVLQLPGVGPYTAGAIMSIAFNQPYPAVDGNVKRVFSRLFAIADDVKKASVKRRIEGLARDAIPEGRASDFNQALMELGALICIPKSPRCSKCPVQGLCAGFATGEPEVYPIKSAKRPPKPMVRLVLVVRRQRLGKEQVLLQQNPNQGMLAGLWAFPGLDLTHKEWDLTGVGQKFAMDRRDLEDAEREGEQLALLELGTGSGDQGDGERAIKTEMVWAKMQQQIQDHLAEEMGIEVEVLGQIGQTQHTFTHRVWTMPILECQIVEENRGVKGDPDSRLTWVIPEEFGEYAIPTVYQKVISEIWNKSHLFRR